LLKDSRRQRDSIHTQVQAGEMAPLAAASAEVDYNTAAQSRLDTLVKAQQAFGQLEDAVQSPLTLPPETLEAAKNEFFQTEK
jgi:hypothetical protein